MVARIYYSTLDDK